MGVKANWPLVHDKIAHDCNSKQQGTNFDDTSTGLGVLVETYDEVLFASAEQPIS